MVKWFNDLQGVWLYRPGKWSGCVCAPQTRFKVMATAPWQKNSRVEFEVVDGPKGPQAQNVFKL